MYPMMMMLIILTMQRLLPIGSCQSCDNDVSKGDDVDDDGYGEYGDHVGGVQCGGDQGAAQ